MVRINILFHSLSVPLKKCIRAPSSEFMALWVMCRGSLCCSKISPRGLESVICPLICHFVSMMWIVCFIFFQYFLKIFYFYFILLYNTVLVLSYIDMDPPWVYMSSQIWTPLPPPTPDHLSGSSLCTSPKHPISCIEHRLALRFLHDSIHVSMPFSLF